MTGFYSVNWRSRGYLPHFNGIKILQFVTVRLFDSLPQDLIVLLLKKYELNGNITDPHLKERFEQFYDNGFGCCFLQEERVARIVENALKYFDGSRYELISWVIMPNHVHILLELLSNETLSKCMHSFKSYTSSQANRTLGRTGPFWFKDYFDTYIRDERHLAAVTNYIEQNPVSAKLCKLAHEWRFSSAPR